MDGEWRTIRGVHVLIGKDGSILKGPKTLQKNDIQKKLKKQFSKNKIIEEKAINENWEKFKSNIKNREFVEELKKENINSIEKMRKYWVKKNFENFTEKDTKFISKEESIKIIRDNIDDNTLKGWFLNADSSYKEKIETKILENKELRNAGLNIAYYNYLEQTNEKIKFNDFIKKDIKMYRGEHGQQTIKKDVFKSYTTNIEIAKKFGNNINEIKIKPIKTLGSYQTTGENEYLVYEK